MDKTYWRRVTSTTWTHPKPSGMAPAMVKSGDPIFSDEQEAELWRWMSEMPRAMGVILQSKSFRPGWYESEKYGLRWSWMEVQP